MIDLPHGDLNPIENVITKEPAWLLRSGTSLLAIFTIICLILSGIISFPDSIKAPILITSTSPPVEIKSKYEGRIEKLYVSENDEVVQGQLLVVIENDASYEQIKRLTEFVNIVSERSSLDEEHWGILYEMDQLGDIQAPFDSWLNSYIALSNFEQTDTTLRKIRELRSLKEKHASVAVDLEQQLNNWVKSIHLQQKKLESQRQLVSNGGAGALSLVREEQDILDMEQSYEEVQLRIKQNDLDLLHLEREINQINDDKESKSLQLITLLKQRALMLKSSINNWERKYLLTSPVNGVVSAKQYWSEYQELTVGRPVLSILRSSDKLEGRLYLPERGAATVKRGQEVKIELDSYPSHQFGTITGTVETVSTLSGPEGFPVQISLPISLVSSYGIPLKSHPGMKGEAEIITHDSSILHRLFDIFRYKSNDLN